MHGKRGCGLAEEMERIKKKLEKSHYVELYATSSAFDSIVVPNVMKPIFKRCPCSFRRVSLRALDLRQSELGFSGTGGALGTRKGGCIGRKVIV